MGGGRIAFSGRRPTHRGAERGKLEKEVYVQHAQRSEQGDARQHQGGSRRRFRHVGRGLPRPHGEGDAAAASRHSRDWLGAEGLQEHAGSPGAVRGRAADPRRYARRPQRVRVLRQRCGRFREGPEDLRQGQSEP